jgi:AraC family transcriptional regulator, transcriptional activator of pobA
MKVSGDQPYIFRSISELMRRLGQPAPLHPLIAVVSYENMRVDLDPGVLFGLDFYKISFKMNFKGQVRYGQGYYDFEEGGLAFIAPNQLITAMKDTYDHEGCMLFFHADLIRNYALGRLIGNYGFFSYAVSEALYLSDREKKIVAALFNSMEQELATNIDQFSQDVLVSQIDLLLNYSNRFYNRQFITRKAVYHNLIHKMDAYLSLRFDTGQANLNNLPTVQEVSDHLGVSPRYLTDMLKSLTGQNTQQHIHARLIEKAKDILSTSSLTVAEIAYGLGFEHPQSFNKLFRQKTNCSPVEFRRSFHR